MKISGGTLQRVPTPVKTFTPCPGGAQSHCTDSGRGLGEHTVATGGSSGELRVELRSGTSHEHRIERQDTQ